MSLRWAAGPNDVVTTLGVVFMVAATVCLVRWRPPVVLTLYTYGIVLMALLTRTLNTRPRFLLTAFPLLIAVERTCSRRAFTLVLVASTGLLVALTSLSLTTLLVTP